MDLATGDIVIMSGEGTGPGTFERYFGARTPKAIRAKLYRERCHGDRWAELFIEAPDMEDWLYRAIDVAHRIYNRIDTRDWSITGQSTIPLAWIKENPAAMLRAGKPNPKARANGEKGGRPRKA